ncbi:hypothetical protein [uncultured Tateyamaria sp.]|uniref:hypothetical protein n=1 Tax=uncultured Tateyamaria sp. TaxID=455651 RepID=UPI00260ABA14|nr:hypothetical protein [uncultured Tateyamaria sp.]
MSIATHNKLKLGLAKVHRNKLAANGATAEALSDADSQIEDLKDTAKAERKVLGQRRDAQLARFGVLDERFQTDGFKAIAAVASEAAETVGEYVHRSAQDKINAGLSAHRNAPAKSKETRVEWDGSFNESSNPIQNGLDELREDI